MNIFEKLFKGAEKVAEAPLQAFQKLKTIFEQVEEDTPELKAALLGFTQKAEAVGGDLVVDTSADGLNVQADMQTLAAAADLIAYFRSIVLPVIEKIYGQVKADVSAPAAPAASSVATSTPAVKAEPEAAEVKAGPGLEKTVAA
jgi:hypothetical protein